jgi:ectoine hydroxylase-related dioxygenase (phytanoyl-CoA dioxygenase family)
MTVEPAGRTEYRVNPDLVQNFRRDGHVLVKNLAPRDEVAAFRPVLKAIVDSVARQRDTQGRIDDYSRLFTQVTNVWKLSDAARAIVFSRRFAAAAAQLLGTDSVRLYHDQALFKPPGAEATPWHQDRYYWPLETDLTVTMWLPLVDVAEEMGPVKFASGSHRTDGLGDLTISDNNDRRLAALIADRGWPVSTSPLSVGDATFHSGGTLHAAGANRSGHTREVLTVIYFAAGTRAATPTNPNQQVDLEVFLPGVNPGEEAASELNPVLYP